MTIVGFNFTTIDVKREGSVSGKVSISNNVSIKDMVEIPFPLAKEKQKALRFGFEFSSKYEPKVGNINLGGDLLYLETADKAKKLLEEWKKSQKVETEVMKNILNTILAKGNILALILSQEVNLPPPIPLPKVNIKEPEQKS
ncbi:MAG TPA: hypothetical protein VJH97_00610 [Candidatus Nanoarchaeia archaeon]|nr:hypothetical protein [Candidatus Nanoarchaeia archaeon]